MIIEPYTWYESEVVDVISVARNTIAIRVKKPIGYRFTYGQYAIVRTYVSPTRFLVRQYSLSSPPSADWLEFTIQREEGGEVTTWLHANATIGTKMELSQSFGSFTFNSPGQPLLFIAGRVGIAPFMSYVRERGLDGTEIIYSVRSKQETCYWDEIEPITTRIVTSQKPRIDTAVLLPHIKNNVAVYICGSRQFAEAIQAYVSELGVPAHNIRRELFTL